MSSSNFLNTHDNVLSLVGKTPLVRLNKVTQGLNVELYAKVEFFNPGGSVKDRIGMAMIDDALKRGVIKPGGTLVEATSGNTGMGLAIAAAVKGFKCVFVIPDKMSMEKIKNLRAFGARVVVTPTGVEPEDPRSHYSTAKRIAKETPNAIYLNQYDNLSNRKAHYETTGPELWEQTNGKIDGFIAGMGTGGTITGTAMYLKEKNPKVQIVGIDPVGSILYDYFKTGKMGEAQGYKVEGIGEDFIPANFDFKMIDEMVQVSDKDAMQMTRKLLLQEGLFVGTSCGAAVAGAVKYARSCKEGQKLVVLLPDSGSRYLSKVFDDDWMRENGFLETGLGTIRDLLNATRTAQPQQLITAKSSDSVERVVAIMHDKGISQIPVMDNSKVVGTISETKLLAALFEESVSGKDQITPLVESNVETLSMDDDVDRASQAVSNGRTALVVGDKGVLSIITKIDLISYLSSRRA